MLPITVVLGALHDPYPSVTEALDCNRFSVRLSFRTDPIPLGDDVKDEREYQVGETNLSSLGSDMHLSVCNAIELWGEEHESNNAEVVAGDTVRQALVFSIPSPAFLACRRMGQESAHISVGGGVTWEFARYKEPFQGCINHLEALLIYADRCVSTASHAHTH